MDIDLSRLKFGELDALRGRIDERIREMRDTEGPALRERFAEEAAAQGLTLDELVGTQRQAPRPLFQRHGGGVGAMPKFYRIYSVIERPKQEPFGLNIGPAFQHEKGEGFTIVLQALPLVGNGKLIMPDRRS